MRKVLVVDDEADARLFVRTLLEEEGWEVHEASDGDAALTEVGKLGPDLIVLDVQMPKKDGFTVFGELPETGDSSAKVIMLTGVREKTGVGFSAGDVDEFLGRKPDAYVEKPIDPQEFKRIVREVAPEA